MRYFLLVPIIIYIAASLAANFNLFPEDFMQYSWFDDVAHILIFGSLTVVALIIAHRRHTPIVFGLSSITLLAIVDEFSQLLLVHRSFSYQDLQMSLIGILLAGGIFILIRQRFFI